jgi:hypothetical protein
MFYTAYMSAHDLKLGIDSDEHTGHLFLKPVTSSITLEPNQSLSGYGWLTAKEKNRTLSIVMRGA